MIREWTVQRDAPHGVAILGTFTLDDGRSFCSLERLGVEVAPGRYRLTLTVSPEAKLYAETDGKTGLWSPHQDHRLPLLNNVAGRSGCRVHALNQAKQSDGCIGVADAHDAETLEESRPAVTAVVDALQLADNSGDQVWLTIGQIAVAAKDPAS